MYIVHVKEFVTREIYSLVYIIHLVIGSLALHLF